MLSLFFSISRTILAIVAIAMLPSTARCQEPQENEGRKAPVLLRVICKRPVPGASELKIVQGEKILHDLPLAAPFTSEPLGVGRGELLLARVTGVEAKPAFDPILKLVIPDAGRTFVLALFAAPEAKPDRPYHHRLIRTDGLRFGASDLYVFNLTQIPIGGLLGTTKFALAPNESRVLTPVPEGGGQRVYQSRFFYQQGGETRIFNDTRWPLAKSARVFLFFIPDPERHSVGYQSFREYAPFP